MVNVFFFKVPREDFEIGECNDSANGTPSDLNVNFIIEIIILLKIVSCVSDVRSNLSGSG